MTTPTPSEQQLPIRVRGAADLGRAVRETRVGLGLSQAELARDARVGRQWLVGLEAGDKGTAPLDMVLRVLRALDLAITLDPAPASPARQVTPPPPMISASEIIRRHTGLREP